MTSSNEDLGQRIEQLIQEHMAASRVSAHAEAVARAFAPAASASASSPRRVRSSPGKKRPSADIALLGERFYRAVSARPGETMMVLAVDVGASARELSRSVNLLRQAGRVRAVRESASHAVLPDEEGRCVGVTGTGQAAMAPNKDGADVLSRCASQHFVRNASTFLCCLRAQWASVIKFSAKTFPRALWVPKERISPQHEGADLPLRVVVGRLDPVGADEGPERGLVLHDVGAHEPE